MNIEDNSRDRRSNSVKRERAKMLAPLNIQKDDIEAKMVQNGNVAVVEPDYLTKSGIFLNNSKSSHSQSDFESKIEKDLSDLKLKNGYQNDSNYSNGNNNYGMNRNNVYEGDKYQSKNFGNQNTFEQDQDGYKIPMSKNVKTNNSNQYMQQNQNKQQMMYYQQENYIQPQNNFLNFSQNNQFEQYQQNQYQHQYQSSQNQNHNTGEILQEEENKDEDELRLDDLDCLGVIGSGSQGHVEKSLHKPSGSLIALKVVKLNSDENFLKALKIELNTLQNCASDYIVKCYGAFLVQDTISIALEFMDKGSLADILKIMGTISETILGMITFQVLKGLEYLHKSMKVIHRDIKPSNLLVNSSGQVKIADFGVSGKIDSTFDCRDTWVGTLPYMSPERCRGESYNFESDIWSLGLTIVECALGRYPYVDPDSDKSKLTFWDLLDRISAQPVPTLPNNCSQDMKDFVSICLRKEVGTRTSASELLKHKFVAKYCLVNIKTFQGWLENVY